MQIGVDDRAQMVGYVLRVFFKEKWCWSFIFLSVAGFCITAVIPYLNGSFIDFLVTNTVVENVIKFALLVAAINLLSVGLSYYLGVTAVKIACKTSFSILRSLIEKYEKAQLLITEKLESSYVAQRTITDTEVVSRFVINTFVAIPLEVVMAAGIVIFFYSINPIFCFVSLVLAAIYLIAFVYLKKPLNVTALEKKEATSSFFESISSQIGNVFSIQLEAEYSKSIGAMSDAFSGYFPKVVNNARIVCFSSFVDGAISVAFQAVLLVISGAMIIDGSMTVGEYVMVSSYFSLLFGYTKKFMGCFQQWQDASASMDRINEINTLPATKSGSLTPFGVDELCIKDLQFSYSDKEFANRIFNGFNFTFKKSKLYAIVGENGSGKSTFFKLLTNLYESSESIYLDGIELGMIEKRHLLSSIIAAVPQKLNAMPITVREQLKNEAVRTEGNSVCLASFLKEMSNNLDKKCTSLSGGELRKLFLWVAVNRPCQILILDEPTTGLDRAAKQDLCSFLESGCRDKIVIVMTHDEDLIRIADYAVEMQSVSPTNVSVCEPTTKAGL